MKRVAGLILALSIAANGCLVVHSGTPPDGEPQQQGPNVGVQKAPVLNGVVGPWGEPITAEPGKWPPQKNKLKPLFKPLRLNLSGARGPQPPTSPPAPPANATQAPPPAVAISTDRTQIRFAGPAGAKLGWYVPEPGVDPAGNAVRMANQLELPGRYNLQQASIYRMRLAEIPNRPGLTLYPTIEVVPANPKTDAFLSHNFVPVEFTDEDLDQVSTGNYVTKVVYLPEADSRNPFGATPEEVVSSRLDPGVDPVVEAQRRGHIMLVVRMGGINLEGNQLAPPANAPAPLPNGRGSDSAPTPAPWTFGQPPAPFGRNPKRMSKLDKPSPIQIQAVGGL